MYIQKDALCMKSTKQTKIYKEERNKGEKKQGRKLIKLKENYPKLYYGSLLFKIFVQKLLILVDDLNILLL